MEQRNFNALNVARRLFTFVLLLSAFTVSAQLVPHNLLPPKPNPPRLVNDLAGLLSPDEERQLEQKLVAYDDSTSNQILIVTVDGTKGYSADYYATEIGQFWGVGGQSKFDNGIVLLVSTGKEDDNRQYFLATGYGLEGALPAITTNAIAQQFLVPNLRSGDYYQAFDLTTTAIMQAAAGEYTPPAGYRTRGKNGNGFPGGAVIVVIIIIILAILRGRGGGGGGGFISRRGFRGGGLAPFIIGSMLGGSGRGGGFGGGFGGGGGGGGFGGFGGGGFGGGGSGGSW